MRVEWRTLTILHRYKMTSFNATPHVVITSNEAYANVGTRLSSGDIDNDGFDDLIVCSPFFGRSDGMVESWSGSPASLALSRVSRSALAFLH